MEDKPAQLPQEQDAAAKQGSTALTVNTTTLNEESLALINEIIAEKDTEKTKDLTYLFNQNQNKKTMVRINKLSDLMDAITDEAMKRFTTRPDEISSEDLVKTMKTVQDMIERGQQQVSGVNDAPLIQINQQTNEVNVGNDSIGLKSRESRKKVEAAVSSFLAGLGVQTTQVSQSADDAIDVEGQCVNEAETGEQNDK